MATAEVGVAYVRLVPSMDGFSKDLSKGIDGQSGTFDKKGDGLGRSFTGGFTRGVDSGAAKMKSAGDRMALGISLPLLALGKIALDSSTEFNAGMANIATLIPGNVERVNELKGGIQDLSIEVGKSTTDLSEGMYNVVSAFGDSSESMALLDINARAATAGMATTTDAINLTSAVTKGYGDTSAEAVQKAADLGLMTVRLGQTDFPALAASMGAVIPSAQNLGVAQEELFGVFATFTGVTGGAAEVSTQLKAAMESISNPTKDAAAAFEAAGFSSGQAAVDELGLAGALGILTSAYEDSGAPLNAFVASTEAHPVVLGLAGAQAETYADKLDSLSDAAGATDEAFAEATGGVNAQGFEMEQAKAQAAVLAQRLGDGLAPALSEVMTAATPAIDGMIRLSEAFTNADPSTQKAILGIAGFALAAGPVMSITSRLLTPIMALGRGMNMFRLGLMGVQTAGTGVAASLGRMVAWFGRLALAALKAGLSVARAGLSMVLAAGRATASMVASIAVQVGKWVLLGVQSLLAAAKVAAAWLISLGPIGLVVAAVIGLVGLIIANWDTVARVTAAVGKAIAGAFMTALNWVKSNWPVILAVLTGPIGLAVLAIVRNWDTIKSTFGAVGDFIGQKVTAIVGFFTGLPGRIAGSVSSAGQHVQQVFTKAGGWVLAQVGRMISAFRGVPGRMRGALGGVTAAMKAPFSRAFSAIKNLWNSTIGGFGFTVPDWVPSMGGKGWSIPRMHTGGIVGGQGEQLRILESGEGVFTTEQMAAMAPVGSGSVAPVADSTGVYVSGDGLDRSLLEWLRRSVRVEGGGNVQTALGQ